MNLQEQTYRIREMMGVNEQRLFEHGGINWFKVNLDAKDSVEDSIEKEFGVVLPLEINRQVKKLFPRTESSFYKSLISDLIKGSLSTDTITDFKNHMTNYLSSIANNREVADSLRKVDPQQLSKVKSPLAKPLVKFYINKLFSVVVPSYFINGMLSSINDFNPSTPESKKIVSNSNKLINQISSTISNDSQLKNSINSIVSSFITKI